MVKCCQWLFSRKYQDMDEEEGRPRFAATAPPPRPVVAASTIGRSASSDLPEDERERRRQLAAERAEQRQESHMARGVGDVTKVKQLQEKNQREELLGRLEEQYAKLKEEFPMALRLADLDKLKKHSLELQKRTAEKG
eukprot:TRINITY_DN80927_c0_g1_i1.p1 TRINITY_DN80927_c0_g1~~TRINITY_DN80927_c0_g1_i1.p1  ORF type:complete len:138 (+),score=49.38 TRINITY_DN80927_c0_g1_i1:96-509(+)